MSSEPARYDAIADWYIEFTKDWDSEPLALLPDDLRGLRVLDLACGYGQASRYLAQRGARVSGLDISAALLSRARQLEADQPLGIRYVRSDAASTDWWDGVATTACCATWRSWTSTTWRAPSPPSPRCSPRVGGSASRCATRAIREGPRDRGPGFRAPGARLRLGGAVEHGWQRDT